MHAVSHSFGQTKVLDDVELQVGYGESVAIMGRSGSGKTTLLSCLLGLITPQVGEIHLGATALSGQGRRDLARVRSETVGTVFQHSELVSELTAEENVALPALMNPRTKAGALDRARTLLADLAVPTQTRARDLSGGEAQRTALARALINSPSILLADEPTGALDTELRDRASALLFDLARINNCALILVTHDPLLAGRAGTTYHLDQGKLRPAQIA
ncbi:ATP-binding cassette domain-containing protein [Cellulosimicrobium sp. BIT-GX5]|uniref:ATP-binding cassette domain-containing protein n=1 Tax=Cellulosimicrobium composti TaxID=2672572 RepID=A0A6N7ZN95_9MICO|nr:ATP-binding cassette domain-containing protein [Cellulosimicrobium composti]